MQRSEPDLVAVCRAACGVQAQVMSCARLSLWTRMPNLDQAAITSALNDKRTLVKTSCMRQTLHLLPSADFAMFIAALKQSRIAAVNRVLARFGIAPKEIDLLNQAIMDALGDGPLSRGALMAQIKSRAGRNVVAWMGKVWSVFRQALAEGWICYGPDKSSEVTFVRVDNWLPKQKQINEATAKQILLRRFLSSYGPGVLQDFSKWSGISIKEATPVWKSLEDELMQVSIDGRKASILSDDYSQISQVNLDGPVLRLLPGFDSYILAHADKSHLVNSVFYKKVYRNQGWISAVVLLDGRIIGTWSTTRKGKGIDLTVELFGKSSKMIKDGIDAEAARLERFLEAKVEVSYNRS
jgi:hypothetical protein